jgi:hypothetical protein
MLVKNLIKKLFFLISLAAKVFVSWVYGNTYLLLGFSYFLWIKTTQFILQLELIALLWVTIFLGSTIILLLLFVTLVHKKNLRQASGPLIFLCSYVLLIFFFILTICSFQLIPLAPQDIISPTNTTIAATSSSSMSINNDCTAAISSVSSNTYSFFGCTVEKSTVHIIGGVLVGLCCLGAAILYFGSSGAGGGFGSSFTESGTQVVSGCVGSSFTEVGTQTVQAIISSPQILPLVVFLADKKTPKLFCAMYDSSGKLSSLKAVGLETSKGRISYIDSNVSDLVSLTINAHSNVPVNISDIMKNLMHKIYEGYTVERALFYTHNLYESTAAGSTVFANGLPPFFFSGV